MKDTRQRIMEASFLLFLRKGFKAVKLSEIERETGITKGTFYYHFSSKKEVLIEGVHEYYRLLNIRRDNEHKNINSLRDYLDVMIGNLMDIHNFSAKNFNSDIPEILCLSLLVEVLVLYPEIKSIVAETKASWLSKLESVIENAKLQGEVKKNVVTSILAKNLLNVSLGVINYLILHQEMEFTFKSVHMQYEQLYEFVTA